MIFFSMIMINLNHPMNYLNKKYICEHAKSGKCDGIFSDSGSKCGHEKLHHIRKFEAGFCNEKDKINCSEAIKRGLKNPRQCVLKDMIEEIIDNKMFEI